MISRIILLVLVFALASCDSQVDVRREYAPVDGLKVIVQTREIENWEDRKVVALFFSMKIVSAANTESFIDLGKIKTMLNDFSSAETWLATPADYDGNYEPGEETGEGPNEDNCSNCSHGDYIYDYCLHWNWSKKKWHSY